MKKMKATEYNFVTFSAVWVVWLYGLPLEFGLYLWIPSMKVKKEMFSEDDFILKKSENLLCSLMRKPGKMSEGDLLCS